MQDGNFVVCYMQDSGAWEYLVYADEDAPNHRKKLKSGPQGRVTLEEAKAFVEREAKKDGLRGGEVQPWIYRLEKALRR